MNLPRIIPHLWFDKEAVEAAGFYASLFPDSAVTHTSRLHDTPSGDCDIVSFQLWGQPFMAISAGPLFRFNQSISFMVNFDPSQDAGARSRIDAVWKALLPGGQVFMPLDRYPFSERYGWIQDRYGLSWQLILTDPAGERRPPILPSLLFAGEAWCRAEEATDYYISVFGNSRRGRIVRYPAGLEPAREGSVLFTDFMLAGQWLVAMDSARPQGDPFNEAVSLIISCDTQEEIDFYWGKLLADPDGGQCGWLKDRFGVSWQVTPAGLGEMMRTGTREQIGRVTQAFLPMKKFDLAALRRAFEGR